MSLLNLNYLSFIIKKQSKRFGSYIRKLGAGFYFNIINKSVKLYITGKIYIFIKLINY
jgi:4-hydroxyphenylpyruvate dioxygenase-like putative hemolysin